MNHFKHLEGVIKVTLEYLQVISKQNNTTHFIVALEHLMGTGMALLTKRSGLNYRIAGNIGGN